MSNADQFPPNFSFEEMTASQTAARLGLDNIPQGQALVRLRRTAWKLEQVRTVLGGHPVEVSSGYRSIRVNQLVGGSDSSAHCRGDAGDIKVRRFGTPLEVCRAIAASGIPFDQLIHEFGAWCHISFDDRMRGQLLTIDNHGTRSGLLPVRRPPGSRRD